ncbi:MAG: DASS family sodium-coupled anion symporter [Chloroherpetonaceae bacterium]|nr:DASS family sodium-coupled anion symporter [Chloroherpetonaceae bacterium]
MRQRAWHLNCCKKKLGHNLTFTVQEVLVQYSLRQRIGLLLGIATFVLMLSLPKPTTVSDAAWKTAALTLLMAMWWITEAIPIFATALLPAVLLPMLDIASAKDAMAAYANPIIFLFMGGFFIALAIEERGLHRRIALWILSKIPPEPITIVGGFMLVTALISMWVSNSATTLMMLPIGQSVVDLVLSEEDSKSTRTNFATAMMLGIAYSSSIGGMGTLVGTPPNAYFAGYMNETYGVKVSFAQWALVGIPLVFISLPLSWLLMTKFIFRLPKEPLRTSQHLIASQLRALGKMTEGEKRVAIIFGITALLWIFEPLVSAAFPKLNLSDAGIAMLGALLLFLVPVDFKQGEFVMSLRQAQKLPFDTLLLFGGGISLAQAIQKSGLAKAASESLAGLSTAPILVVVLLVALAAIFATELIGNTALAATMLPIVAPVATAMGENPYLLLLPVTFGVSCAFMLPVGTPPNAIVYASGLISAPEMAKAGFWLNMLFTLIIVALVFLLAPSVFDISLGTLPDWSRGK